MSLFQNATRSLRELFLQTSFSLHTLNITFVKPIRAERGWSTFIVASSFYRRRELRGSLAGVAGTARWKVTIKRRSKAAPEFYARRNLFLM